MSIVKLTPAHPALKATTVVPARDAVPMLFVVVDTEEEFDWSAPFDRGNTGVRSIPRLLDLQKMFDHFRMRPTYVIDYPVATQPEAFEVIREIVECRRGHVGAHLHPWVTPPFSESVNRTNSYACNLGEPVEEAKLRVLTDAIEEHVGIRPRIYKAGRYGFGPSTVSVLERLDYDTDVSVNPLMDFSADNGPNFEAFTAMPFFFGTTRRLLEVPCTHGFAGFARTIGRSLHRASETSLLRKLRFTGVLSRTGALNKVMLSPETSTLDEMKAVTRSLLADGVRTFTVTFHSPSAEPGHTPYVRTAADLRAFVTRLESFLDYFLGSLGGEPGTIETFRRTALSDSTV
jgi:hypothetical protein